MGHTTMAGSDGNIASNSARPGKSVVFTREMVCSRSMARLVIALARMVPD